jgi:flagellar biosynthesis protein FlhF
MGAANLQTATLLAFPGARRVIRPKLAEALRHHRLPQRLVESLLREAADWPDRDLEDLLACMLAARMCLSPVDLTQARGILLIGPSGAGKSAVAEKLAFRARALGRPVDCRGPKESSSLLRGGIWPQDRLTILETEGFNPINPRAASAFSCLSYIEGVESIGVVSALTDAEDISEIVAALRFRRVIVTGLDQTRRLGAAVAAATGGARLAHIAYGPRADDALDVLSAPALAKLLLQRPH